MDNLKEKVVIAVSSRALFDLEEEHALFEEKGYKAFRDHQVRYQNTPLRPGVAFPFVRRLLALNELYGDLAPFRVIALSRNSPETAQRFFHSCRHYRLPISAGGFTSGHSTYPYLAAFNASLFLSANPENVRNAIAAGQPAGLVMPSPVGDEDDDASPTLRIAFDFDGVIADDESEREYQKEGLSGFHRLEQEKASTPHSPGPLRRLFEQLSAFQRFDYNHRGAADPYFEPAVRISIVTARGAPSEERLITTLKSFGMSAAELFLLDGLDKQPFLKAIRPHIFFDDQANNLKPSLNIVPSVLVPFGGREQMTPTQVMAALLPVGPGHETEDCSVMAYGFDPYLSEQSPFLGAATAVVDSVAKLVAAGCDPSVVYLSFQEYFEKLRDEPARWGKPFAALLGAFSAQMGLGAAAIGGKDSMSGSFLDRDVPPTLISFAIAPLLEGELLTTDLKAVGHGVYLFAGKTPEQQAAAWERFTALARAGKVVSAWAVENGLAEAVMKMSFGNEIGFAAENTVLDWFAPMPGAIVAELSDEVSDAVRIGVTTAEKAIALGADSASIEELAALNDAVLEAVYPTKTRDSGTVESFSHETKTRVAPAVKQARPKALIPVFPGTNCEYDTQRALSEAGADAEQFIVRNLTSADVADSVERFAAAVRTAQMIVIPGGFSGGDEPDGSAKLITAFFRNAAVREQVTALLEQRDGLMLGICNGFQALIKLGLVPYGRIMDTDESFPTLTYNVIGRHQSKLVRTRVCSTRSPWLAGTEVGDIYTVPISHGEGRFLASQELIEQLAANGQIATQYAGLDGYATMDTAFNPNGSVCAIEGITSPDGRVFGKMGHSERIGPALYRNVPGTYDMHLFASAVRYFKK